VSESRDAPLPWLAVAGKGGSGKSVVSGTLARLLAQRGHRVLAVDSDPMPGLARSLGVEEPETPPLIEAAERDGDNRWRLKPGIGPVRAVKRFTTPAPDGVRLLQLGKADKEGLIPVMGAVNAFLHVVHRFEESKTLRGWTIVGDLPAGPRHPAAGFSPYAHLYVVVVEPRSQSALTARRVARIARDHRGAEVLFVANKIGDGADRRRAERLLGEPFAAVVPADEAVAEAERHGAAVIDTAPRSPAVLAIEGLADAIEARTLRAVRQA
jgi:CO dehydrogenase maturation factor